MPAQGGGDRPAVSIAEAAHVRHLLEVAGQGPGATAAVAIDLMIDLVARGFSGAVAWYLAPDPDPDDAAALRFSLRLDPSQPHDWHDGGDLGSLLGTARRSSAGSRQVELWSGDGGGLHRLALGSGPGEPLRPVTPTPGSYEGDDAAVSRAIGRWRARDDRSGTRSSDTDPVLLAGVVADALSEVAVEVDLHSLEQVVGDAVRAAVPELGPTPQQVQGAVAEVFGRLVGERPATDPDALDAIARAAAERVLEASGSPERPGPIGSEPPVDPIDVARRVAASVLSPSEIAESLVFRLRPVLDDEAERARRREATGAERHRRALDQLRLDLQALSERFDRRLDRLETGRAPSGAPSVPPEADP